MVSTKFEKIKVISLSILGAFNVVMDIFTPIMLVATFISVMDNNLAPYQITLLFMMGLLSSLFRGIKIGLLK